MPLNKGIWDPKLRGTNIKGTNLKSLILKRTVMGTPNSEAQEYSRNIKGV